MGRRSPPHGRCAEGRWHTARPLQQGSSSASPARSRAPIIGSPFRAIPLAPRPPPPSAARSATAAIHGRLDVGLAASGTETLQSPRTTSARWIASIRGDRCVVCGRSEVTAVDLRVTAGTACPAAGGTTRAVDGARPALVATGRGGAGDKGRPGRARFDAVAVIGVEPISMPPPASGGPSELSPTAAGDAAAADGTGGTGDGGGAGGELAVVGGAGTGTGCGAGGASGTGGGLEAPRGGRKVSGSTYVSLEPTRTPRWTYGTGCSASPLGPASESTSPSETDAPRRTRRAPRWVKETLVSPSSMVTVSPCVGTCPANVTSPATGARTERASPRAMSTPRC